MPTLRFTARRRRTGRSPDSALHRSGRGRGGAIALPRGCKEGLCALLEQAGVRYTWEDGRWEGRRLAISFKGALRDEQQSAADELLRHEQGILAAPTGYGKTVIAAYLIGALKAPTLIIVPRTVLVENWIEKLSTVLSIEERPEPVLTKSGRPSKRQRPQIGRVGGQARASAASWTLLCSLR